METPIEVLVKALVRGVQFAPIDPGDAETATVRTLDGSPLPLFVQEALRRDRLAVTWTIASLARTPVEPGHAPLMLLLLGSGYFRRFIEKNPSAGHVYRTGEPAGSAQGKRG